MAASIQAPPGFGCRPSSNLLALVVAGLSALACGDDSTPGGTAGASGSEGSTTAGSVTATGSMSSSSAAITSGSTGGEDVVVIEVPEDAGFDWCAANVFPVHGPENLASLFGTKYRIAFEPGVYAPGEDERIPFRFELREQERAIVPADVDDQGILLEHGVLNPDQFGPVVDPDSDAWLMRVTQGFEFNPPLGPEPWWDGMSMPPWLALIDVAATPEQLELSEGEMILGADSGFVTRVVAYATWFDPCELPEIAPDRTTVVLEDGEVSFETRKLTWTFGSGFATRASGTIEGLGIETSDYTRVTYTENTPMYMTLPVFAAKLDQPGPAGECAFVVWIFTSDPADPIEPEAWFIDCDDQLLRQVPVLDMWTDFAPTQDALPWDPRAGSQLGWMPDKAPHAR